MRRYALVLVLSVTLFFSLWSREGGITTMPKFWRDEAIPFEIARTFAETGKLDVAVAPGVVEERSYLTHATGFPVTVPLAGFFKLFGIGVLQSRLYMVLWILATIATLFFVVKNFFGFEAAVAGSLFVATFAPFFANGRTSTGEIPGFFFLLWALYFLYKKERFALVGIFFALAAVSKPSVYLLIIPAVAIEFLISDARKFFARGVRVAAWALPIFLFWIWLIVPHPFLAESWKALFEFYGHPFHEPSLLSQLPAALGMLARHTTILYIAVLAILIAIALARGVYKDHAKRFVVFTFAYGIFAVVYYLRSPGWLRFLLVFELLLLASLFPALKSFSKKFSVPIFVAPIALLAIHIATFFFFSNIPVGRASIDIAEFINKSILTKPGDTIGLVNLTTVAPLIASDRKYQIGEIGGSEIYGQHPLLLAHEKLPTYIISFNNDYRPYEARLTDEYQPKPIAEIYGLKVFKKK